MAFTNIQNYIISNLLSLIHRSFNIDTLNKELSNMFEESIHCEFLNDDDNSSYWTITFNSEKEDTYGYFDLHVLKLRNTDADNSDFYVTDIGYEFE